MELSAIKDVNSIQCVEVKVRRDIKWNENDQNTNLFFRKRDDSAAGVFAPSNYPGYSTYSTHTLSCNQAAMGLWINFHAGFIVIIVE